MEISKKESNWKYENEYKNRELKEKWKSGKWKSLKN